MEDRLRREVSTFVRALAEKEFQRLTAAGTLVEIEELTAEIGDEVARQLAGVVLQRRSDSISERLAHECPDCGRSCPIEPDAEPIVRHRNLFNAPVEDDFVCVLKKLSDNDWST